MECNGLHYGGTVEDLDHDIRQEFPARMPRTKDVERLPDRTRLVKYSRTLVINLDRSSRWKINRVRNDSRSDLAIPRRLLMMVDEGNSHIFHLHVSRPTVQITDINRFSSGEVHIIGIIHGLLTVSGFAFSQDDVQQAFPFAIAETSPFQLTQGVVRVVLRIT